MADRTFEDTPATRARVPLLLGLVGPSGGGKTFSALRLATGIQQVSGGEIYFIDTEARRALHYADRFAFRHLAFGAPFGPLDYLAAIEHCVKKGAGVVIVDSMSHEHEGPGGVLEMHSAELDRLAGNDYRKRDRMKMLAWQKPKSERRRLLNSILQLEANFIFCFRAKEKMKLVRGEDPKPLGWMPIAGEEFVYEMTANALLLPGANGVPTWNPEGIGEKVMVKMPEFAREMFANGKPLDEATGARLAQWAAGDAAGPQVSAQDLVDGYGAARSIAEVEALHLEVKAAMGSLSPADMKRVRAAAGAAKRRVDPPEVAPAPPHDPSSGELSPEEEAAMMGGAA